MKIIDRYSPAVKKSLISIIKRDIKRAYIKPFDVLENSISGRNFIFIAGCGHSGTTLLASRLSGHPDCYLVGRETAIFQRPNSFYTIKK